TDRVISPQGEVTTEWIDVTPAALGSASSAGATGYGMGVAVADYDGDGRLDLYVTNAGPNQLWRNRGDGTFEDVTRRAGTGDERWSTSATFFDYDADGRPDLFVVNYVDFRLETHRDCRAASGALDYCGPLSYEPESDRLYRNRGDGIFEDVTARAGLGGSRGNGLGAVAADFDRDGWADLFVANDQMENFLWRNDGDGTFSEEAALAGVAVNREGDEEASMGVVAADLDEDGALDLFMTHLDGETHTLYRGDGEGLFRDRTAALGLAAPTLPMTGFGAAAVDVDLDGWRDLYVADGAVYTIEALRLAGDPFPFRQPDQLFLNRSGERFESLERPAGETADEVGRGVAAGDPVRRGRVGVVVFNSGASPWWLEPTRDGRWLGVLPSAPGLAALGPSSVVLRLADGSRRHARTNRDGSYASSSDAAVLFGLGEGTPERISIERTGAPRLDLLDPPEGRYLVVPVP
ncbi:MAG: VCBS repeat-containing protein, partial [Thermoanaerobaculia bacterium]|nr:VCBS repeat-containing protein [Thermoanaerobaculia bacterium]